MSRRRRLVRRPVGAGTPPPNEPRRRDLLAGAAAGAGALAWSAATTCLPRAPRQVTPPRFEQPIIVDVHCHDFNASDLPITGFVARTIPGLTELSRAVNPFPELLLRRVVGTIHGWLNATAPSADEEASQLRARSCQNGSGVSRARATCGAR